MQYSELHNHTFYSPLDGLSSPAEYFKRAKEIGIGSIAITDHGTLAGHRHFLRDAKDTGIRPVLGVEAYISETDRFDRRSKAKREEGDSVYNHIILLGKNDKGVKALNTLSGIAWNEGFYEKPRIDFEVLSEHGDDLIVLSGCMSGLISRNFLNGRPDRSVEWLISFKERFGENFYIEIQTHNAPELNHQLLNWADEYNIKPVLTGDCHYADPADKWAEEACLILGTGVKPEKNIDMSKANKMDLLERFEYMYPNRKMSFKDIDVFLEKWDNRHNALKAMGIDRTDVFSNTVDITNQIEDYNYVKGQETLPILSDDTNDILVRLCNEGMKRRGFVGKREYEDRLKEELDVILNKDLASYFIILWDALKFCRQEGIAYGSGRGSAAGSLVAYILQITEVDPLEYNLLFWRFLDPERADTADIDVDIQDSRRAEVKRYLENKYGKDRVASVTTYTFYQGKSAIKAACRVLNIPFKEANAVVAELVADRPEDNFIEYMQKPSLTEFRNANPDVIKVARKLSGRLSGYGMHAGGVIITEKPTAEWTGVESRSVAGEDYRQAVTSVDKDDAEEIGLVKYDFLGIKTLSVVADSIEFIRKNYGKMIDFKKIKEDDPRVFQMISDGNTLGVFQAEASASTKVIKEMGIENFADLVASNALVRPGAWKAFGQEYIARKKGYKKVSYPTPGSQDFLMDTYGFYLFQEQTMLICTEVAGMSKGTANKVRKLTAKKKDKDELAPFKKEFIEGATKQVSQKVAEKLWADIELTAEYSFNKCLAEDTTVEVKFIDEDSNERTDIWDVRDMATYSDDVWVSGPKNILGTNVGEKVWHKVKTVHDNGVQNVWRIWTDSETYIDATAFHKHRLSKGWKQAYRIHQNDVIWTDQGKAKVAGRRYVGQVQTYDIELYDEPHAFYANGFLTHNSHAVAYSKLSYVTAWLKYYYPAEFMAALLKNEKDSNSVSDYLAECKRLKITVKLPDVNESESDYTTKNNVIYMGLSNIKYISDKLAQRLILNRPYTSYEDLRTKIMTKGSGLNTRVLESINKIGAADFPDRPVDHEAVKANLYEYLGIPAFDDGLITEEMQTRLVKLNDFPDKGTGIIVGLVQDIVSKNGWIRVDITDGTGKLGMFVDEDHGFAKGSRYVIAVGDGKPIGVMNMADFKPSHYLLRYLRGEMSRNTWMVAAKSRITGNGNRMATVIFSHNDQLMTVKVFSDMMMVARQFAPGMKVRIALNHSPKWGASLKAIIKDERDES